MISEAQQIKAAASAWLAAPSGHSIELRDESCFSEAASDGPADCLRRWRPTRDDVDDLSVFIGECLNESRADRDLLQKISVWFDRVAEACWPPDKFGERHEVCSALSFLAWRHSSGSGMEVESQAWLRISDQLAFELSVESETLSGFLFLPRGVRSADLEALFLDRPIDIYLGLAILRRERGRRPLDVLKVCMELYDSLLKRESRGSSETERAFFLGEFASLAASLWRVIGKRNECASWLGLARQQFVRADANKPLLAKVQLIEAVETYGSHHYEKTEKELAALATVLCHFEMPRETLLCKLILAMQLKDRGENALAAPMLAEIVTDWRDTSEQACFSTAASGLAELRLAENDAPQAAELAVEALFAARASGDRHVEASAWSFIAVLHRDAANSEAAVCCLETSIRLFEEAPSVRMAAYLRVFLAEVLIENRRYSEALDQLLAAVPGIQSENMIVVGVHALKLLSMLPLTFSSEKAALRSALTLIRKVEQ